MDESRTARIMRQVKEICEVAGVKTEEYAKVTKRQLNVVSVARELNREKAALGARVFELSRRDEPGDVFEDVTAQAILGRIRDLEATLTDYEEEIAGIHEAANSRATDIRRKYDAPPPEEPYATSEAEDLEVVAVEDAPRRQTMPAEESEPEQPE